MAALLILHSATIAYACQCYQQPIRIMNSPYYSTRNRSCVFRRRTLAAVVEQFFKEELENNANYSYATWPTQMYCSSRHVLRSTRSSSTIDAAAVLCSNRWHILQECQSLRELEERQLLESTERQV
ncbi:hypothetical protein V8E52_003012 [Russula decolorans]